MGRPMLTATAAAEATASRHPRRRPCPGLIMMLPSDGDPPASSPNEAFRCSQTLSVAATGATLGPSGGLGHELRRQLVVCVTAGRDTLPRLPLTLSGRNPSQPGRLGVQQGNFAHLGDRKGKGLLM